jgi:hypothetical protein
MSWEVTVILYEQRPVGKMPILICFHLLSELEVLSLRFIFCDL